MLKIEQHIVYKLSIPWIGSSFILTQVLKYAPLQSIPFPEYPSLQLHENEPCVLLHKEFKLQL